MASSTKKIAVIAHRGASGNAPENTISSIKLALEMHVDMIEIDVHLSKDSVPVVIHDETLSRTTNGNGNVKDYSIKELKKLDAGKWFSEKYINEQIPTLEEVLEQTKGKCILLIEIKNGSSIYPNIEKIILNIIKDKNAENDCIIQSFDDEVILNLENQNCSVQLQKLVTGNIRFLPFHLVDSKIKFGSIYRYKNVSAINLNFKYVNKVVVNKIHAAGQKTFCWTVNKNKDMIRLIDCGVDGIITNYPEKLIEILKK